MPRTAKPSKGCLTCKQRHVKCDETRPECLRCIKSRRNCPGYAEGLDLVLRDQNQITKVRAERRQKVQAKSRTQSPESSSSSASPAPLTVYSPLPESQDLYAQTFFVVAYANPHRDLRTEHGFLEILPLLFDKLSSNSVLSLSLATVAHCYFGAWEPAIRDAEQITVRKNYTKALGALQKALRDPQECVSDEVLMAVCLLSFFEDTISSLKSRKQVEDHIRGATALLKQRRSVTMTSDLSKRLLIAVRHSIVSNALTNSMPVPEAPEIWQDPDQMPHNPVTLLNTMRISIANALAAAAEFTSADSMDSLSDEVRSGLLARANAAHARFETWPALVPQEWWPITLERRLIPQQIIDAGVNGDYCYLYTDVNVCGTWLIWYTSRVRILGLIADLDQSETEYGARLQIQQAVDDLLAAVPFMLGSKTDPADIYDMAFEYPCLPGESVSADHYQSAAAFGGLTLWIPFKTLLEHMRHLRSDQLQFAVHQIRRLGRLYDVRMPDQDSK